MKPVDTRSPRELFGDAVEDEAALKRAYARLLREHRPDEDPEGFAAVRRLYEQARADLAAGRVAPAGTEAAEAQGRAEPIPVEAELHALLAEATEENLGELAARCLDLALRSGEPEALTQCLRVHRCRCIEAMPEVLLRAADNTALHPRLLGHAAHLFGFAPTLARHPAFDALPPRIEVADGRIFLVVSRFRALWSLGRAEEAWRVAAAEEAWLRSRPPEEHLPPLCEFLRTCAWVIPEDQGLAWADRLGELVPEPLEGLCLHTEEVLRTILAARRERQGDTDPLADLPERLHHQPDDLAIELLREAAEAPDLAERLAARRLSHPVWTRLLWVELERLGGMEAALWDWQASGTCPCAPPPIARALVAGEADRLRPRRARVERGMRRLESRWWRALALLPVLGLGVGLLAVVHAGALLPFMAALWLDRVGFARWRARLAGKIEAIRQDPVLIGLCRELGLWPQELAAALDEELVADGAIFDRPAVLRSLGDEHIRRVQHPLEPSPE